MCWRHTQGARRVGETRGVSRTRQGAQAYSPPLPDVPSRTRPAEMCAPLFNLSTLLKSAAHRQNTNWDNEEPRRITRQLFYLPLLTRARPPRRAIPISARCAGGAGDTPPHPQAALLFWCARTASVPPHSLWHTKIPPTRRATLHYSGGCSSCSHIVSWGVGMMPATMHPVSSCCA